TRSFVVDKSASSGGIADQRRRLPRRVHQRSAFTGVVAHPQRRLTTKARRSRSSLWTKYLLPVATLPDSDDGSPHESISRPLPMATLPIRNDGSLDESISHPLSPATLPISDDG